MTLQQAEAAVRRVSPPPPCQPESTNADRADAAAAYYRAIAHLMMFGKKGDSHG